MLTSKNGGWAIEGGRRGDRAARYRSAGVRASRLLHGDGQAQRRRERVEELERDRDAVIESYAGVLPGALESLSGEERRSI